MKAFSLLELILVLTILTIISFFIISNYKTMTSNSNLIKLKADVAFIQNGILKYEQKKLLLNESIFIYELDNAMIKKENENLFTNILEKSIYSTDEIKRKVGFWIKKDNYTYEFVLSSNKVVKFIFKDNKFICIKNIICKEF